MNVVLEALNLVAQPDVIATIMVASLLGIVIGAIPGLTAVMGVALLIPAMERAGFSRGFAAAITQTSSVIGPIIPPRSR